MAETTAPGRPLRAGDPPQPGDAYGRAKLASESALAAVAAERGLDLVVIRPPLVHGPEVGGNFRALTRLAGSALPLPFAAVDNRRSVIFIDNLVDLIAAAAVHPQTAAQVLLAADGAFSTATLIRLLAEGGGGRAARLFALPDILFAAGRRLPGIGPAVAALTCSLEVDDGATRALLGWTPPVAGDAGLTLTARAIYRRR